MPARYRCSRPFKQRVSAYTKAGRMRNREASNTPCRWLQKTLAAIPSATPGSNPVQPASFRFRSTPTNSERPSWIAADSSRGWHSRRLRCPVRTAVDPPSRSLSAARHVRPVRRPAAESHHRRIPERL